MLKLYNRFDRWYVQRHFAGLVAVLLGVLGLGWSLGSAVASSPPAAVTLPASTRVVTHRHTVVVRKIVKGRIVLLPSGIRVVRVPVTVIRTDACNPDRNRRCVRRIVVPAHTVRLREATLKSAVVTAAAMPVTVTAYVPVTVFQTVTVSEPAVTLTQTDTTTDTQFITITISVPAEGTTP